MLTITRLELDVLWWVQRIILLVVICLSLALGLVGGCLSVSSNDHDILGDLTIRRNAWGLLLNSRLGPATGSFSLVKNDLLRRLAHMHLPWVNSIWLREHWHIPLVWVLRDRNLWCSWAWLFQHKWLAVKLLHVHCIFPSAIGVVLSLWDPRRSEWLELVLLILRCRKMRTWGH